MSSEADDNGSSGRRSDSSSVLGTAAGIDRLRRLGAAGSSSRDGSPRALPPVSYTRSHSHEQKPRRPSFGTPKGLLMYNCAVGHPPVHQKAVSCTNRISSGRGTYIHDDTERFVHGRARFAAFPGPPVRSNASRQRRKRTRSGGNGKDGRSGGGEGGGEREGGRGGEGEAKAEGASAGRGGIPGPTGNSAKSRGPATGAFGLRRERKKHSGVAGHDVGAHR